ncbi:MAG TPA: Rdx family protein [Deferrisomatales bacterium]|nr:Rdx family protein [Deferrisomatales bacterium]
MPTARSLAGKMEEQLGVTPELIAGGGGIFDVHVGEDLVYSKFETGGFPDEELLVGRLKQR